MEKIFFQKLFRNFQNFHPAIFFENLSQYDIIIKNFRLERIKMKKIYGSVIIEQGVTFAIVVVSQVVTNYTSRIIRVRQQLQYFFPNMPIILMSQEKDGTPHFYGRRDIVEFLKSIRLDQIPWKEYHIYWGGKIFLRYFFLLKNNFWRTKNNCLDFLAYNNSFSKNL